MNRNRRKLDSYARRDAQNPTVLAGGVAAAGVVTVLLLTACATAPYQPAAMESVPFRERADTQVKGQVEVRASVLGPDEAEALFDLPLYERRIQPLWLEIKNAMDSQIRYAPVGTDPDYFSPQEVAYVHRGRFSADGKEAMNRYFGKMAMPRRIPPGETRSGFVFTHAHPGTKAFNVDIFGPTADNDLSFTFFIDVPGFVPDRSDDYFENLYVGDDVRDLSRDELRSELAAMDLHTLDETGQRRGLPVNVVVVGEPEEVLQALIRAGWLETPRSDAELASTSERLFGRIADVVFTKNKTAGRAGNELRFWLSPMREQGVPIWFAQVTRHVAERRARPHLDPDMDDAAGFLIQELWYGQGLARYAWVKGLEALTYGDARRTHSGEEYFTQGYLAVMWLSGPTVSMLETDSLSWDSGPVRANR